MHDLVHHLGLRLLDLKEPQTNQYLHQNNKGIRLRLHAHETLISFPPAPCEYPVNIKYILITSFCSFF